MDGRHLLLALLLSLFHPGSASTDPNYDHQTTTYKTQFKPVLGKDQTTVTPFFSPDHSIDTYVKLIEEAEESIDIFAPGFSSWSKCTPFEGCIGCSLEAMKREAFPVFPALLNARHQRGVTVRLLTNNYGSKTCPGLIAPLDWLSLNGVEIRYYTTTTFMHTKYVMVDKGKKTSVSSVNFSHTSFMRNREAGVVMSGGPKYLVEFYSSVFESDWNAGTDYKVGQTYNASALAFVRSKAALPVNMPTPSHHPGAYITTLTPQTVTVQEVYTGPDDALATITDTLSSVRSTLYVMMYQITGDQLCDQLLGLYKKGMDVKLLLSDRIFDHTDWEAAQACYKKLYEGGMKGRMQKTPSYYEYSHQKFWIVDNATVHLSSGNWSPSDFPSGDVFPPYGSSQWQHVNRDFLIIMSGAGVVNKFYKVFSEDWQRGTPYVPYSSN